MSHFLRFTEFLKYVFCANHLSNATKSFTVVKSHVKQGSMSQCRIQGGRQWGRPTPIGLRFFSISRLFPYKRHIVRCVYLQQITMGLILWLSKISESTTTTTWLFARINLTPHDIKPAPCLNGAGPVREQLYRSPLWWDNCASWDRGGWCHANADIAETKPTQRTAQVEQRATSVDKQTRKTKAKTHNTYIAPQAAYRSCSGAVHVTDNGRTAYRP